MLQFQAAHIAHVAKFTKHTVDSALLAMSSVDT